MENDKWEWYAELLYKSNPLNCCSRRKKKKIPNRPNETTDVHVKSTAVSQTSGELDKHSKDSKKVNSVPENQPESL